MAQRRLGVGRGGFTLIEILLVVVIIAIASAVALPSFARSFRGAKLRTSTRLVLGMHRNAQTKAVLGQRYMAILFDQRKGTLELVEQGAPERKKDEFFGELDGGGNAGQGQVFSGSDGSEGTGAAAPAEQTSSQLVRTLEDGVKILAFDGGKEIEDLYYVSYYPNGMCDGYQIEIGDSENRTATITVDPVTGKAKVGK